MTLDHHQKVTIREVEVRAVRIDDDCILTHHWRGYGLRDHVAAVEKVGVMKGFLLRECCVLHVTSFHSMNTLHDEYTIGI